MKICCVIPVRLESARFPRKALYKVKERPLLFWTWEQAVNSRLFEDVVVATDSEEVYSLVTSWGGRAFFSVKTHSSGTERLLELYHSRSLSGDVWVNWQVDTVLMSPSPIQKLLAVACTSEMGAVFSLYTDFFKIRDFQDSNKVKVILDQDNGALYFSRAPVPFGVRESATGPLEGAWRHIGIYAYTESVLSLLSRKSQGALELLEGLEQLSFLEKRVPVKMVYTKEGAVGVEVFEDIENLEKSLG